MTYYEKYYQIINYRKENILQDKNTYQKHHIKPKSIYPELVRDKDNIVRLTYIEHFKVHVYLYAYYKYELKDSFKSSKMACALECMSSIKRYPTKEIKDIIDNIEEFSLIYEKACIEARRHYSKLRKRTPIIQAKPVLQYSPDGNFIKEYKNANDAKIQNNYKSLVIPKEGRLNTSHGYIWKYKHTENFPRKIQGIEVNYRARKPVLQYDMDGNFVREWKSFKHIKRSKLFKGTCTIIHRCLKNKKRSGFGFIWKYKTSDTYPLKIEVKESTTGKKPILQYDLNGKFIKLWDSISQIEKMGYTCSIFRNLSGVSKSAGGYIWKYKKSDKIELDLHIKVKGPNKKKKIGQYDLNGNLLNVFVGVNEAAKQLGILRQGISKCLAGKYKSTFGYIFKEL